MDILCIEISSAGLKYNAYGNEDVKPVFVKPICSNCPFVGANKICPSYPEITVLYDADGLNLM